MQEKVSDDVTFFAEALQTGLPNIPFCETFRAMSNRSQTDFESLTAWRKAQSPRVSLEAFGAMLSRPVSKPTVLRWERDGIPAERVREIAELTGLAKAILRPDIFGDS